MRVNRQNNQIRKFTVEKSYIHNMAERVLVSLGNTKVICSAGIADGVPKFLDKNQGWLTAEYSMLPSSTHDRCQREAAKGKQSGRTLEIQRLISRSLRQSLNLKKLIGKTIHIDCDVLQADGGTRVTSITGGCIALFELLKKHNLSHTMTNKITALSVGAIDDTVLVDLNYEEDSNIHTDLNLVVNALGQIVEVQATAEKKPLNPNIFNKMMEEGIKAAVDLHKSIWD
jgi:ribonuclease PH